MASSSTNAFSDDEVDGERFSMPASNSGRGRGRSGTRRGSMEGADSVPSRRGRGRGRGGKEGSSGFKQLTLDSLKSRQSSRFFICLVFCLLLFFYLKALYTYLIESKIPRGLVQALEPD